MTTLQVKKAIFTDSLVSNYNLHKEFTELSFNTWLKDQETKFGVKASVLSQSQINDRYRLTNVQSTLFNIASSYTKENLDQLITEGFINVIKVNKGVKLVSFVDIQAHTVPIDTTIEQIKSDTSLDKDELLANMETIFKLFKESDKNRHYFLSKKPQDYLGILDNKSFLEFLNS